MDRCTVGVRVTGSFGLCDLLAWGRAPDGWWALIGWHEGGVRHPDGYPAAVYCTGWVRGESVSKWAGHGSPARVVRVHLDGQTWPRLFEWTSDHYFGPLDPEAPPPLPAGFERIQFASSRR